jgi:hypothetical protein
VQRSQDTAASDDGLEPAIQHIAYMFAYRPSMLPSLESARRSNDLPFFTFDTVASIANRPRPASVNARARRKNARPLPERSKSLGLIIKEQLGRNGKPIGISNRHAWKKEAAERYNFLLPRM